MSTAELWTTEARAIELYDWQGEAINGLRSNIRAGVWNQILAAATGSGKTVMASYLIQRCQELGQRALFVCDRIPLIDQTSATFDAYGIPHGVIQADHWRHQPWQRIQVASAQTLSRRKWPEDLSLIVVDEAHTIHRSVADRIARRDCVVIGLTATPFTKGLGRLYDQVVTVRTTRQLIADGYLTDYRIWSASVPDMTGVKVSKDGEWDERETEARVLPIIGDIVTEYLRHGQGRKFIAFGATVDHCAEIQRQMMAAGVHCGLYTYKTGDAERSAMVAEFRRRGGHLQGLVSVAALAKGFDVPAVEVVILARPLRKALGEHIQMIGRGLRRDPENPTKVCTILDHAGNCTRFWADMNDFFENGAPPLDDGKRTVKKKAAQGEREPYNCPRCAHVHDPRPMCPSCGHEYPKRSSVEHVPGTLSELTGFDAGSRDDRQSFYAQLLGLAMERGYRDGWAAHKYKERYGAWPAGLPKAPEPPSNKTRDWVRSRMIAWAKGKEAAHA